VIARSSFTSPLKDRYKVNGVLAIFSQPYPPDLPYASGVENYPGLGVHGPLQATLLLKVGEIPHNQPLDPSHIVARIRPRSFGLASDYIRRRWPSYVGLSHGDWPLLWKRSLNAYRLPCNIRSTISR
jgi:hypothetical protein